jgi:rRNA maturation endonuclease Nob1
MNEKLIETLILKIKKHRERCAICGHIKAVHTFTACKECGKICIFREVRKYEK